MMSARACQKIVNSLFPLLTFYLPCVTKLYRHIGPADKCDMKQFLFTHFTFCALGQSKNLKKKIVRVSTHL